MKLFSGPLSLFARKVEIALAEKGLAYEREMVPFTQAQGYSPKHPAVLAANPKGQVPVLVDGDLALFDSTLIFEYLEDAYPAPPLYPRTPRERARCRMLELVADDVWLKPLIPMMRRNSPPDPDPARQRQREDEAARAEDELRGLYRAAAAEIRGDFLLGDQFTVADIALFMMVVWTQRLGGPALDSAPALAAWYARLLQRPSCATAAREIAEADRVLSPGRG
ncbi:MAG: glutathione S-transferase family protein [Rhodospirillales bacterium]|nr:glutathione S-transferase family protein [Rhodospirillales bacterium]